MIKRITPLIFICLCMNTIFPILAESLTRKENIILQDALSFVQKTGGSIASWSSPQEIDKQRKVFNQFLQENKLTPIELYNILQKKRLLLVEDLGKIYKGYPSWLTFPSNPASNPVAASAGAISVIASLFFSGISTISFVSRFIIDRYAPPSTLQKIAHYGLTGLGIATLIPEIALEFSGEGYIVRGLFPAIYETITRKNQKSTTLNWIMSLIHELAIIYPEVHLIVYPNAPQNLAK